MYLHETKGVNLFQASLGVLVGVFFFLSSLCNFTMILFEFD